MSRTNHPDPIPCQHADEPYSARHVDPTGSRCASRARVVGGDRRFHERLLSILRRLGAALLFLAFAQTEGAHAGSFTSLTSGEGSNNAGPYQTTGPRREVAGEITDSSQEIDHFCVRYQSINAIDLTAFGNVETETANSEYWATFSVRECAGTPWTIRLESRRRGALTIVNDHGGYADAYISSVSATITDLVTSQVTTLSSL